MFSRQSRRCIERCEGRIERKKALQLEQEALVVVFSSQPSRLAIFFLRQRGWLVGFVAERRLGQGWF